MKIHTVELPLGEPGRHEVVLLTDHGQALTKMLAERDAVQAQLAEAVGLLREVNSQRFTTLATVEIIESFIGRHSQIFHDRAQAEQQEAQEIGPLKGEFAQVTEQVFREQYGLQEAQGAQADEFQREDRYIVIKRKDLVALHRDAYGPTQVAIEAFYAGLRSIELQLPRRGYLVIEGDWPEYEPTWAAIKARVEGRATQPAVQVNPEPVAHLKVEVMGRITKVDIEWPNGLHTTLPTRKYPLYIVRGAEHE